MRIAYLTGNCGSTEKRSAYSGLLHVFIADSHTPLYLIKSTTHKKKKATCFLASHHPILLRSTIPISGRKPFRPFISSFISFISLANKNAGTENV
jgi:hypothetical protein